jgi:Na+/melibiose symporter-like transporter
MHGGDVVGMVFFLVTGIVLVSWIFFRSKEKQMMIEKGLSYEQMVELLRTKRDPFLILKLGVLTLFVGFGLGLGFLFNNWTTYEEWIPFWIVTMTGLGFIFGFMISRKMKNGNDNH